MIESAVVVSGTSVTVSACSSWCFSGIFPRVSFEGRIIGDKGATGEEL